MLEYKLNNEDGNATVALTGRIDSEGAVTFQQILDDIDRSGAKTLVLNMDALQFINSAGIGKLLFFYKRLNNRGGTLLIKGIHDDIFSLFKAIKLDKLIPLEK
ncbi:STAS domain-containing protein [bacterium]|nr:STAS domain-containing protein [bacterium]